VSFDSPQNSFFQDLEITNTSAEGVTFTSTLNVAGVFTYNENTTLDLSRVGSFGFTLLHDVSVSTDLTVGGPLDLAGHALTVPDHLTINSLGSLDVNGGHLSVGADVSILGSLDVNGGSCVISGNITVDGMNAYVKMMDAADVVAVGGNALFGGSRTYWFEGETTHAYLSAGTLRVGGDFTQQYSWFSESFRASGTHKVVLNGSSLQTVTFDSPQNSFFQDLEITNASAEGVNFTSPMHVAGAFTHSAGTNLHIAEVLNLSLVQDLTLPGDLTVKGSMELAGNALMLTGNLTISAAASLDLDGGDLDVEGNTTVNGLLDINGGHCLVVGDLTISGNNSYLRMMNNADLVEVGGNMTFGGASSKGYLTAGVLKVAGNFFQTVSKPAYRTVSPPRAPTRLFSMELLLKPSVFSRQPPASLIFKTWRLPIPPPKASTFYR